MEKKDAKWIIIDGKQIKWKVENLDIHSLRYYLNNPRINSILASEPAPVTQEIIEKKLWNDATKDLFQDIKRNNGLIEEIIVKGNEVLEGNSRLCAYRKLWERAETDKDKEHWKYIRAKILPGDITEEQIFVVLGTLHIKGKAEWRTYEQASYIYRMVNEYNKTPKEVAETIGHKEKEIIYMIESYKAMNESNIKDLNKFSYFIEFFKNRKLAKLIEEFPKLTTDFPNWVKKERIPRAELVRKLPDILIDKKARKAFIEKSEDFLTALDISHKRHPEKASSFYSQLKKTAKMLDKAKVQKIAQEIKIDHDKKYIIHSLARNIKRFCHNIGLEVK